MVLWQFVKIVKEPNLLGK